jgi:hypothetical protein
LLAVSFAGTCGCEAIVPSSVTAADDGNETTVHATTATIANARRAA